ncbi:MAG TPA: HlyD family efflux transporter periplasmic adaptor subunit [Longimicrobiales bacterium]|nr:HlyD family efflux transporter periplasmic adaptor subunit [Longimicrobiales bacterium]
MKPSRIVPIVLLLAAAAAAIWWFTRPDADAATTASGTVEVTEADLGFRTGGRVASVAVEEGDAVAAGDTLARLESAELAAALSAAEAESAGARARLADAQAGPRSEERAQLAAAVRIAERRNEEAERERQRAENLFEGGAISRQQRDAAFTAADVAEQSLAQAREALQLANEGTRPEQIAAARAAVQQAEAQEARARAALEDALVIAPFAGRVTVKHREPGEVVGPGVPVLTLQNPDDRWVRIYVRADRIGTVQVGQAASITSDTFEDRAYEGVVSVIGSEAEFTPRNVQTQEERTRLVYPVKVRITGDPGFELKPGVPADVELGGAPDTAAPSSPGGG